MEVVELKCPNCGKYLNEIKSNQKFTTCKNCDALIILDEDNIDYNLEGTKEEFIKKGDFFNEHNMYAEALNEYRKAYLLDKTNEHVNYEMDRLSQFNAGRVVKHRDYKKYGDIMVGETVKCPNCGSNLKIEDNKQKAMYCEYCGTSVLIKGHSDSYQEILDKALNFYKDEQYDEAIVELEELLIKDKDNKYYKLLIHLASSLNKNNWNDIPAIEDKLKDSFKDYYQSLSTKEEKSKAYRLITDYVSRLCDLFEEDEQSYTSNAIMYFLTDISTVLDKEDLVINKRTRKDLLEVLKRDD